MLPRAEKAKPIASSTEENSIADFMRLKYVEKQEKMSEYYLLKKITKVREERQIRERKRVKRRRREGERRRERKKASEREIKKERVSEAGREEEGKPER